MVLRRHWEEFSRPKEVTLQRTHFPEGPWRGVDSVDKEKARLNCNPHLLDEILYERVEVTPIVQTPRQRNDDSVRQPDPNEILVPEIY